MYGQGSGVVGVSSTAVGIVALPNTSGNLTLTILSIVTIAVGAIVTSSFVATRVYHVFNR